MLKKRRRKRNRERKKKKRKKHSHKNYKENIGTKLITNTKKHRLKIQSLEFQKYNIKEKTKKKEREKKTKSQKLLKKYVYEVCFKKQGLFLQNNRL